MGYLVPGHDGIGVPPDGQSSLETAVAVAVPPPAPRRRRPPQGISTGRYGP